MSTTTRGTAVPLTLSLLLATATAAGAEGPAPEAPVVLFGVGIHVEPFGAKVSSLVPGGVTPPSAGPTYEDPVFFARHAADLLELARIAERHGGRMTVQVQSPFTTTAASTADRVLPDLRSRGHEIALHFHEDAHLGRASGSLPVPVWTAVMKEELDRIRAAGGGDVRYWSGGNLYPGLLDAASGAGLSVNSDWKNPATQRMDMRLFGSSPWRPSGGPSATDLTAFATHSPGGKVVYVPDGAFSRDDLPLLERDPATGGDAGFLAILGDEVRHAVSAARSDRVDVVHVTVHPGEYRGTSGAPYALFDRWLTEVVDPLVASGKVRWATFGAMADAFVEWERSHPGVDPRSAGADPAPGAQKAVITFVLNVHDWRHVDESAGTLLRAISIFERYGVKGDFYLTGPMVKAYADRRPDVLERLRETGMTISDHVRPPHPLYPGFDGGLKALGDAPLAAALRDHETYELDLATGGLVRSRPGGYTAVGRALGKWPVTVVAPTSDLRVKDAAIANYHAMGARALVLYHESGTKLDTPFEWRGGLLVRPSDFSVTRWRAEGLAEESFWWNMLSSPEYGQRFDPTRYLKDQLAARTASRPPFVTVLIHENNFERKGPESWTLCFYEDRDRTAPRTPPYPLDAPDLSTPRPAAEKEAIWAAYEGLVAYAATNLTVATSAEIVEMARATLVEGDPKLDPKK